jgi:predicted Fe-S protein YdhL (DUF1289 family)
MGALDSPVASPCISVCVVDPRGTGVCTGCGRTLDEIAAWIDLTDDARRAVLARLPARLAALRNRAGGAHREVGLGRGRDGSEDGSDDDA